MHNAASENDHSQTKPNYDLRPLPNRNFQYWHPHGPKKRTHKCRIPGFIHLTTDNPHTNDPYMDPTNQVDGNAAHNAINNDNQEHDIPQNDLLNNDPADENNQIDQNLINPVPVINPVPLLQPVMAQPTPHSFIPLPPTFYGKADENPKIHVHKFKIYAQLLTIQDNLDQIKTHFGQFLSGRAFLWYSTNKDDATVTTTDGFYEKFINAFLREPPTLSKIAQLNNRKYTKSDTPETYSDAILTLCQKLNLPEDQQIQYLILGLPLHAQSVISALNPTTFRDAYNALCSLQTQISDQFKHEEQPKLAAMVDSLTKKLDRLTLENSPEQALNVNDSGKSTVVCQFCGVSNHSAASCYRLLRQVNRGRPGRNPSNRPYRNNTFSCTFCLRPGHREFECRTKARQNSFRGRRNFSRGFQPNRRRGPNNNSYQLNSQGSSR